MKPVLFNIGQISIYSYHLFIMLGIFLGLWFFNRYGKKAGLKYIEIVDVSLVAIVSAYAGARLFHVLFVMPEYYLNNPLEIFALWKGGFVIYGAILTPIIFVYWYAKKKQLNFLLITDLLTPSLAIGTFLGRFACLFQGCCFGAQTIMPWGMIFPQGANGGFTPAGIPLHPTQIYLSLHGLIMFFILNWRIKGKKFDGELTLWYLILYAVGRFIIEYFRADFRGGLFEPLSTSQAISILVAIVCAVIAVRKYSKCC
ncbi:MAG: prolipoprotein diacylglyceryl transferase [Pseudomonadota bacterium]